VSSRWINCRSWRTRKDRKQRRVCSRPWQRNMVIPVRGKWRFWWWRYSTCPRKPSTGTIVICCIRIRRQWRVRWHTRQCLWVELMVMVIGAIKILLMRPFSRCKTMTEAIVPIMHWHWRWQPSSMVEISKIAPLRVRRRIASTSTVAKAAVRWARLATPRRSRKWIAAMVPDQAKQPIALHRSPSQGQWGREAVRIERGRLAHAHPLVGPLPAG